MEGQYSSLRDFQTNAYLKDPLSTDLGRRIIIHAVEMIDKAGLENFTFRKLAIEINSTEASIYRYFENKHLLLVYLVSLYWSDLYHLAQKKLLLHSKAEEKLKILLKIIAGLEQPHTKEYPVCRSALNKIVISEASKSYLTQHVDEDNRKGYFGSLKRFAILLSDVISKIDPVYPYPHALASTLLEASHYETFFSEHIPSLTDFKKGTKLPLGLYNYLEDLAFKTLKPSNF